MPAKDRRALTMGAILLGLVVVGALAFFAFDREKEPAAQNPSSLGGAALDGEAGEPVNTTPVTAVDSPVGNVGMGGSAGTDAEDANAEANTDANADAGATPGTGTNANAATGTDGQANAQTGTAEPAEAAADSAAVPATHVVAEGETLREISLKYYGDPVYAGDIEALNQLSDPNRLLVGQTLQLPKLEELTR